MLKKTVKYTDFNDIEHQEDFYFHLSKAELIKLEASHATIEGEKTSGGFRQLLEDIVKSGNGGRIMEVFDEIVDMSYGVRSEDGKRFEKSAQLTADFKNSAAYDEFFMELVTDADAAVKFINGIVPSDISKAMAEKDKPSGPPVVQLDEKPQETGSFGQPVEERKNAVIDPNSLTQDEINELLRKRNQQ